MNEKIFDTHAHYDDECFQEDRGALFTEMFETTIGNLVNVGASLSTSKSSIALAEEYSPVYAAIGVHPEDAAQINDDALQWLEHSASHPKVVAIGEIGLDYHYMNYEKELQQYAFLEQLKLAGRVGLPVIIHSRDACEDTLKLIRRAASFLTGPVPGVIHCFSYSTQTALAYVEMGYYIGIGGVVTFANSKKLKEVVKNVPLSHLVLETDCPYLSPVPNRGKRNSSLNLPYVVEEISRLTGISADRIIETTTQNARRLYRLENADR